LPPSSKGFFRAHREQEAQKRETTKVEEELAPIACANEAAALAESSIKEKWKSNSTPCGKPQAPPDALQSLHPPHRNPPPQILSPHIRSHM